MGLIRSPYCFSCGKELEIEEEEFCSDCRKDRHLFTQGRSLFRYEGKEKEAIHKIKYENKREYLVTIADLCDEYLGEDIRKWEIDVLVPIPMHPKKKRKRGYNQAEILAKLLQERWRIPMEAELLCKKTETDEQKTLSAKERKRNLKEAFCAKKCQGKRILLIDDVYTTGSTMDAATEVLLENGAEAVFFCTASIGRGNT